MLPLIFQICLVRLVAIVTAADGDIESVHCSSLSHPKKFHSINPLVTSNCHDNYIVTLLMHE